MTDGKASFEILDSILDSPIDQMPDDADDPIVDWPENTVDPRLARLSYSSVMLFQSCPRKYQLKKLNLNHQLADEDWKVQLTYDFGHMVGEAIQRILAGESKDQVIFKAFLKWTGHIFDENGQQKKSFFHGLLAVTKFISIQEDGFLEEYELVYYEGKPAVELSFKLEFPSGYANRGYVDIVLRNKNTGLLAVFEIKTDSGYSINFAKYKNSSQATGYSTILDKIEPGLTEYSVYYLVYMTRLERWEQYEFIKSKTVRALWFKDQLFEQEVMEKLVKEEGNHGMWPMHGQSCMSYNRECEFMNVCHMETSSITKPLRESQLKEVKEYQFNLSWKDYINHE